MNNFYCEFFTYLESSRNAVTIDHSKAELTVLQIQPNYRPGNHAFNLPPFPLRNASDPFHYVCVHTTTAKNENASLCF